METQDFCKLMAKEIEKDDLKTKKQIADLRDSLIKKHRPNTIPSLVEIMTYLPRGSYNFVIKPTRTMSGVSPVALMTKPIPCPHGRCTYCPGGPNSQFGNVPQSYTGGEPATMRAIRNNYDPYLQVFNRLEHYVLLGHSVDKIELIVMGGTFTAFDKEYQEEFIKYSFKAMNDFSKLFFEEDGTLDYPKFKKFFELPAKDFQSEERTKKIHKKLLEMKGECELKTEQEKNESEKVRCVALCIETKPDWGLLEHGNQILKLGCTRVELGIQSVYEEVIKKVNRGHTIKDTIDSIRILKDLGFKISAHYMPGLPLTDKKKDLEGMKQLFSDEDYRPDMLKIYPTMVSKGTPLYLDYKKGNFKPLTADSAAEIIAEFKESVPEYCRIQRIQRDVPTKQWEAGVELTNFRQYLFQKHKPKCKCIRCREPRKREINWDKVEIKINEYGASNGTEYFISAEDTENDLIIGFIRMRFPSESLREEITTSSAIIRELHVYGVATNIGAEGSVQHKGFGKKLLKKAEEIAKQNKKNKMIIISGIGVKKYYYNLGYEKEGPYVTKSLE